jgi:hypothetical protein
VKPRKWQKPKVGENDREKIKNKDNYHNDSGWKNRNQETNTEKYECDNDGKQEAPKIEKHKEQQIKKA